MGFRTADFAIEIIPFGSAVDALFTHEIEWCIVPRRNSGAAREAVNGEFEWYLDDDLIATGRLPASLDSAPIASWFLARLCRLDAEMPADSEEHSDGGGYAFEWGVACGEKVVAMLQLQGDMEGVGAIGSAADVHVCRRILLQLADALTGSDEFAECCYRVVDPEWSMDPDEFVPTPDQDSFNEYGYRDDQFLGLHNIRER